MRNYLNLRFLESLDCFCYYTEIVLYESKFSLGFYGFYPSFHRAWVLLSLLGVVHCIWGAQFIAFRFQLQPLIFYCVLQRIPAKLECSDWSSLQLTTQGAPPRLGDTICLFNLRNFQLQWPFCIFTNYRDFPLIFTVDSFFY